MLQPGSRPVPNYPDYKLIRKLGAGAFGEVWHAHGPGRLDVALKFIRLDAPARFLELRSLDAIKGIRHPNLVSLFGAWGTDGCLILAMELCDRSLQDRLTEALDRKLPGIPLNELLSYMSDAANGLDALNAKQVQHRDVKPANLLLLNSGVKVADFGLAKALEHTVASNSGAGTLAYTAPECFKGKLTQQSDQYSLAVTYYHLRTGHLLFKGDQAQVMYAHLELKPNLSRFPPAEGIVLARALSKESGERWRSCKVFVDELIKAQQEVARQEAEQRQRAKEQKRDEERQRQDTERTRQEQERQEREAEAAERRRRQEDARKNEPFQSPAKAQLPEPDARRAREICWFCKKKEANGKPKRVKLRIIDSLLARGRVAQINVPRCSACHHYHVKRLMLSYGLPVTGGLVVLWQSLFAIHTRVTNFPLWLVFCFMVIAGGGALWLCFGERRWLRKSVSSFPPIESQLIHGWRMDEG